MRANQLQNQLDEKAKADEAARQKQLEEQNEWKQIAEQEKAKREEYEKEREEARRANDLQSATNEVLGTFSDEVRELATDMGLALNDDSEEAKEAFKQKLEKISAKVAADRKPGANNPAPGSPSAPREELLARTRKGDPAAKAQLINDFPAIKEMRRLAGQSQ